MMHALIERVLAGTNGPHFGSSYAVFFVFMGLLIGAALRGIRGRIKIPYTPFLLVLGLLIGLFLESLGLIGDVGHFISNIEPAGILLIFIPILIFESSFNADWHIFKQSKYQIMLLAGPLVAITFGLVAVTMKLILGYSDDELSWTAALTFGTIISITDPVALVALLKDVGAPHYFSTIVEGETLLNDGTAYAFFAIFSNMAGTGKNVSVGLGIAALLFFSIGGVLIGLAFGFVASLWQERINKDAVLSITIVFTFSYLLLWFTESYKVPFTSDFKIGVSGIVGLCIFGLFMAAFGRTVIPSRVEHPLHSVVSWAQYASETLIFLLCGLLVGQIIGQRNTTIEAADWGKMIAFFVILNLIRILAVGLMGPILNRVGYKLNLKELFVVSYAGLRGSFSLVLALSIDVDEENFSQRTRELILLYTAVPTLLTILVNGLTMGTIIKKIGMIKKFPAKANMYKTFLKEMDALSSQTYQQMKGENPSLVCDWELVRSLVYLTSSSRDKPILTTNFTTSEGVLPTRRYSSYLVNDQDLKTEARCRLLQMAKQLVWNKYNEARIEGHGANILEKAINISLDDPSAPIQIFTFLRGYFTRPRTLEVYTKLSGVPVIGLYFKKLLTSHMILIYEVNAAISEITDELNSFSENLPVRKDIAKAVFKEFIELKSAADSYQNKLGDRFSGIMKYIMTKRCATKMLMTQKKLLEERYTAGEIEEKEYNQLISLVDRKMRKLHSQIKVSWEPPTFLSFLTGFPLFNLLTQEQLDRILETSKQVNFHKGSMLFEEKKEFDGIYLITHGEVEFICQSYHFKKGIGHIMTLCNLVMFDNVSRITCVASQSVQAHKLNLTVLREIMQANEEFEESIYKGAFNLLRFMKPESAGTLINLSEANAKGLMAEARFIRFSKEKKIPLTNGGFVLKGQVQREDKVYTEYCVVPKGTKTVVAMGEGMLLQFNISNVMKRHSSVMIAIEKLTD